MREGAECAEFWLINRIGAKILLHKSYGGWAGWLHPLNFCSINRMGVKILGRESYGGLGSRPSRPSLLLPRSQRAPERQSREPAEGGRIEEPDAAQKRAICPPQSAPYKKGLDNMSGLA